MLNRTQTFLGLALLLLSLGAFAGQTRAEIGITQQQTGGYQPGSPWPTFQGNGQATGLGVGCGATGLVKWQFNKGVPLYDSPAIAADGTIYCPVQSIGWYALDPATGKPKWCFTPSDGGVISAPAIGADGTVYVTSYGALHALDPTTGGEKWSFAWAAVNGASYPLIGPDGTVYVVASCGGPVEPGGLYAVNGSSGALRWSFPTSGYSYVTVQSPSLSPDGSILYFAVANLSDGNNVFAIDTASGSQIFSLNINGQAIAGAPTVGPDGTVYLSEGVNYDFGDGGSNGGLLAIDGQTGIEKWKYVNAMGIIRAAAIQPNGSIFTGTFDGHVVALSPSTGSVLWSFSMPQDREYVQRSPVIGSDGTIYVGTFQNELYALNGETGAEEWVLSKNPEQGFQMSDCAVGADGAVYVCSSDDNLYAIGAPALAHFYVSPSSVYGGTTTYGVAQISTQPAPNGLVVSLSSNSADLAVPASVTVPAGTTGVSFPIHSSAVSSPEQVTLTARVNTVSLQTTVTVDPIPAPASLSINNTSPFMTYQATGTVTLAAPALSNVAVHAASDNPCVTVSSQPVILAGQSSASFLITANPIAGPGTSSANVSVTSGGVTLTEPIDVKAIQPAAASFSPSVLHSGQSGALIIRSAEAADVEGFSIALSSSSSNFSVPATATMQPHTYSVSVPVQAGTVGSAQTVTVQISIAGTSVSAKLTIEP